MPVCVYRFEGWPPLLMPLTMVRADMEDILAQTNGCGRDGIEGRIVPDTIYGMPCEPLCRVHDWMYIDAAEAARKHRDQAKLTAAEHFADGVLAANFVRIINDYSANRLMRWLRLRRAYKYIDAVSLTDLLKVLPQETLVAMGYETATQAMGDMIC